MNKKVGIIAVLMLSQLPFAVMAKSADTDAAVQRLVNLLNREKQKKQLLNQLLQNKVEILL